MSTSPHRRGASARVRDSCAAPGRERAWRASIAGRRTMSRRRRAAVLLGFALILGGLAASDVARREAAVRAQLGPAVEVVVARADLAAGRPVAAQDLALRRVP